MIRQHFDDPAVGNTIGGAFLIIRQARAELRAPTGTADIVACDPAQAGIPD